MHRLLENIITSKDNPVIKLYRRLSSSKKERLEYGLFVLEGLRIVEDAVAEDSGLTHLILTQQAYEKLGESLFQADLRGTKTLVISNELGKKISSTDNTQGVFAICRIPAAKSLSPRSDGRYVVLFGLQDPGNVGMIIRTADALGMDGIILSGSCDLYSPKVIRSTMGSVFRTNIIIENDAEHLFDCFKNNGIATLAAVVGDDAEDIRRCTVSGSRAVFIGNEGSGLPDEISYRCDKRVTIPMNGSINSLNAAMAAGIIMWEMKK